MTTGTDTAILFGMTVDLAQAEKIALGLQAELEDARRARCTPSRLSWIKKRIRAAQGTARLLRAEEWSRQRRALDSANAAAARAREAGPVEGRTETDAEGYCVCCGAPGSHTG